MTGSLASEKEGIVVDGFNQVYLIDTLNPIIYFTQDDCKIYLLSENRWAKITLNFLHISII